MRDTGTSVCSMRDKAKPDSAAGCCDRRGDLTHEGADQGQHHLPFAIEQKAAALNHHVVAQKEVPSA